MSRADGGLAGLRCGHSEGNGFCEGLQWNWDRGKNLPTLLICNFHLHTVESPSHLCYSPSLSRLHHTKTTARDISSISSNATKTDASRNYPTQRVAWSLLYPTSGLPWPIVPPQLAAGHS